MPSTAGGEKGYWTLIGRTPLKTTSCALTFELKARWEGEELFFFDYRHERELWFDFEEGKSSVGEPRR